MLQDDTSLFGKVHTEQTTASHTPRSCGALVEEQSPSSRQEEQNSHRAKKKKIRQMPVLTSLYTRWNWGHRFKIHRESSVSQAGCQRTSHESPENAVLRAFLSVCWRTSLTHQDDGRKSERGEVQPEATAGTHSDRKSRGGMEER